MKKLFLLLFIVANQIIQAQNIGINNTNPQAALDVQGDFRLRSVILTLPVGVSHDVDLTTTKSSVYMFAGGALTLGGFQISGFTGGVDGRIVTIFNNSTNGALQLYDANFSASLSALRLGSCHHEPFATIKFLQCKNYEFLYKGRITKRTFRGTLTEAGFY
jgi:hypothetical protein